MCAYAVKIFDSKTISTFRFRSSKLLDSTEKRKEKEKEEFNAVPDSPQTTESRSNLVHLERFSNPEIIRNRKIVEGYDDSSYSPISDRFPRDGVVLHPGFPSFRDRRLGSKRTKGMHNVTWDEIRGGMCVKRKTARRYKIVMCRYAVSPTGACGDLAFSRPTCSLRSVLLVLRARRVQYETKRVRERASTVNWRGRERRGEDACGIKFHKYRVSIISYARQFDRRGSTCFYPFSPLFFLFSRGIIFPLFSFLPV